MQVCDVEKQARDDASVTEVEVYLGGGPNGEKVTADLCAGCREAIEEFGLVEGIVRRAAAARPRRRRAQPSRASHVTELDDA